MPPRPGIAPLRNSFRMSTAYQWSLLFNNILFLGLAVQCAMQFLPVCFAEMLFFFFSTKLGTRTTTIWSMVQYQWWWWCCLQLTDFSLSAPFLFGPPSTWQEKTVGSGTVPWAAAAATAPYPFPLPGQQRRTWPKCNLIISSDYLCFLYTKLKSDFDKLYLLLLASTTHCWPGRQPDRMTWWCWCLLFIYLTALLSLFFHFLPSFTGFVWLIAFLNWKEQRPEKRDISLRRAMGRQTGWVGRGRHFLSHLDMNEWTHLMVINL